MRFGNLKQDRGVAGLTILLSLITMLFVIGLLVMIFSLMGGELRDATFTTTSATAVNQSNAKPTTAGITLTAGSLQDGSCGALTSVYNGTTGSGDVAIALGNFTQVGCLIKNATSFATYSANLRYNYPYTYGAENTATNVINDTTAGISGVTDWYPIFIVIGAMVVLILLTVIIITSIRGSGMMGGTTNATGMSNVGSA